jgi:hypothetical protein
MIPVGKSKEPPTPYPKEQRRRDLRNYAIALMACLVGVAVGYVIKRSGWGGDFGTLFGILSAILALVCAFRVMLAW